MILILTLSLFVNHCTGKFGVIKPGTVGVLTGKTIVLECISESYPQWTFKGKAIKGATVQKNKIYIPNARSYHTGPFQCLGTYPDGNKFKAIANVFVGSINPIEDLLPRYIEVTSGQSFTITKRTSNSLPITWMFNHGPIGLGYKYIQGDTLAIKKVSMIASGNYTCHYFGNSKWLPPTPYLASFEVKVLGLKNYYSVRIGIPGIQRCAKDEKVFKLEKWTFNEGALPYNVQIKNQSLFFETFEVFNEGRYMCEGQTPYTYIWTSKPIRFSFVYVLTVTGSPFSVVYPKQQSTSVSRTVQFMCDSQEIIQWKFMDKALPSNAIVSGKAGRILTIHSPQKYNQGAYRCIFKYKGIATYDSGFLLVLETNVTQRTTPAKDCPAPRLPHGSVKVHRSGYNAVAVYECDDSEDEDLIQFYKVRYCQADGTWSGDQPICSKVFRSLSQLNHGIPWTFFLPMTYWN